MQSSDFVREKLQVATAATAQAESDIAGDEQLDPRLEQVIQDRLRHLVEEQQHDGHWVYELEADVTIPAEYIMLNHYLDEIDDRLEQKIAVYLRRQQLDDGGWPLFYNGNMDLSASVKAYIALRMVGDDPHAPHMERARQAILEAGGAERSNVFTRTALALFGFVPWHAAPVMPVEVMLLPSWFPFHLDKVSYWSRTVIAPLTILMSLKPQAKNPRGITIRELFCEDPETITGWMTNPTGSWVGEIFIQIDKVLQKVERYFPKKLRQKAIDKALVFIKERLNGEDGLGAIFPAMANTVMAYDALGYEKSHPDLVIAKQSVYKLVTEKDDEAYVQPCLSPVWDTSLAAHAVMEAGLEPTGPMVRDALDWLVERQITETDGDYIAMRPNLKPGGWAFQYRNDHYPDVDDTAVVVMALDRSGSPDYQDSIQQAADWVLGMQCKNGGWGAFDAENTCYYLNHIPFSDHGALLDPPTVDVSARCVSMLAQLGYSLEYEPVRRGLEYLRDEQEEDGSWFGRWGTNYIYGTWSALCAFNVAGEDMNAPHVRKAVKFLLSRQNGDGGWGEDGGSYWTENRSLCKASTPSQTAWALLGLMAAGEVEHPAVKRGIDFLLSHEMTDGARWEEPWYTAVGFPRIFYLRYHGYSAYFPLWALSRYRNLKNSNFKRPMYGM